MGPDSYSCGHQTKFLSNWREEVLGLFGPETQAGLSDLPGTEGLFGSPSLF